MWYVCGACVVYVWHVCGVCGLWCVCGMCVWLCVVCVRYVCGVCVVVCGVWCVEGEPAGFSSSSCEEAELGMGSESSEGERRLQTQNHLSQ